MDSPRRQTIRGKPILVAVAVLWIVIPVFVVRAFRDKDPVLIARVKTFNRRWFNPWMLRHAGNGWWYAARLEHRGRTSGALYATPIVAEPVREGFLIPLPYGRDIDWARNLLHAGEGVLQAHDVRYRVGNPRIVPLADVETELPRLMPIAARLYGIADFLRVDVLPSLTAEVPPPA
jgi:deazaflavin-dependent oxidoreductase (nitroreductase family)